MIRNWLRAHMRPVLRLTIWLAAVSWLLLPFWGNSQIVPNPTSSVTMPTSSMPLPIPATSTIPEMTVLEERVPYAYAETGLDPRLTRFLYLAAVLLAITGILLLAGTAERLWSAGLNSLEPKRK